MKRGLAIAWLLLAVPPAWGAACNQAGSGNALQNAAANLAVGSWCKLTINYDTSGVDIEDYFTLCNPGGGNFTNLAYSSTAAWDSTRHALWFIGTPHGGPEGMVKYDAATNTLYALDEDDNPAYVAGLTSGSSCTTAAPWHVGSKTAFPYCNARHAYDSLGSFDGRYFYYGGFHSDVIRRFDTQGPVWNNSWKNTGGGGNAVHTAAMVYWPEANSLIVAGAPGSSGAAWDLWRYNFGTSTWTDVADVVPATGTDYHEQIEYHPGTGEILYTGGNGSLDHWRLTWTGSAVSVTKQPNTAFGFGITSGNRCVADPAASTSKFICYQMLVATSDPPAQVVPLNSWREFNMTTNTWTSLSTLGVASMPPIRDNLAMADGLMASIDEYGVMMFVAALGDTPNNGIYIYKHTASGAPPPPPQPPSGVRVE